MQKGVRITLLLFVCLYVPINAAVSKDISRSTVEIYADSNLLLAKADSLYQMHNYPKAAATYELLLNDPELYHIPVLKKLAFCYAGLNNPNRSISYIDAYFLEEFDTTILMDDAFDPIKDSREFKAIVKKYTPSFGILSFLYLYVAFIGFFVAITLNLNKRIDRISKILMSLFIFIHSFFILHICLNITNYQYKFPHSYLMSTSFSFLYGPLLYFYFKRVISRYTFRKKDLLHLIPTLLFLLYIIPIYSLSKDEKLAIMLGNVSKNYNPADAVYIGLIVSLKLASLLFYGYFIRKLYQSVKKNQDYPKEHRTWLKNIFFIHLFYICSYAIYGTLISNHIASGFFYHFQIICMAIMVIYAGYTVNVQPNVFSQTFSPNNKLNLKYEKSGLTESLSNELKTQLIQLFDEEKIYKVSNINLEILAKNLNTTRHNTSQVINEHFNMSFHELINTYRIHDAKQILNNDDNKNFNIIDIAYEVGYNNKVTFNKAFKKETNLTPSEYQRNKSLRISS